MIILNTTKDIQWLKDTHLKSLAYPSNFRAAILYGNEDCPSQVVLYSQRKPEVTHRPIFNHIYF